MDLPSNIVVVLPSTHFSYPHSHSGWEWGPVNYAGTQLLPAYILLTTCSNVLRMNEQTTTTRQECYRELNESLKAAIEHIRNDQTIDKIIEVVSFYEDSFLDNFRIDDESSSMSNIEFVNMISDQQWIDYIDYMRTLLSELNDKNSDRRELNDLFEEVS